MSKDLRPETRALRMTTMKDLNAGSVSPPIYTSTTYEREPDGTYPKGYIYSRIGNPNRQMLEESMANLEHGKVALAFSSGMAAIGSIFQSFKSGDHIIISQDAYFTSLELVSEVFERWGLKASIVDTSDLDAVEQAFNENTTLVWLETPSNPQLRICDIQAIAVMATQRGAHCAVDNTWASPVLQNPIKLGADIVMHSTTKYLGGHSDVMGGMVVLKEEGELFNRLKDIQEINGAVPSPFDCWLVARGIKTLFVRMNAQMDNASRLAEYLENHDLIESVHYPGLSSHPHHEVAKKQMNGFGAMVSVQVKGNGENALRMTGRLKLFTTATSLGGVESLVEHRKSVEGEQSPTPDNLLRLSVGLEHIDDLIDDWSQALEG